MINQINTMSNDFLEYMVASSLQISVVFILVLILSYIFRNKPAGFLHLLWFAVIFKAMIPPSLITLNNNPVELPAVPFVTNDLSFNSMAKASTILTASSIVALLWIIAMVVLLSIFIVQNFSLYRNLSQNRIRHVCSHNIENSLKADLNDVPLYISRGISTPMTTGFIHPKIYLPEDAINWDKKKFELIISHEMAHIKRKDAFTALFQGLIQIIYFFHPLVWFANRQISLYQEQACDDHALLMYSQSPHRYGNILISFLEPACATRQYSFLQNLIINDRRTLKRRIKYLTKQKEDRMLRLNRIEKTVLTGLLAFTFVLSCQKEQTLEQPASQQQIAQDQSAVKVPVEEGMIIGSIVDKKTGEALPGANIFTSDTEYGAASNFNGDFEFLLPAGTYEIGAQFLGFKTQLKKNVNVRSGMQTKLNYKMEISRKSLEHQVAQSQSAVKVPVEEGMIIGSIVDKKTGEALPGANIFTSDTEYGAASNFNGEFQFLLPAGTYEINAQFLGFKSQLKKNVDVRSGMETNLNFEMEILSKKEFEQQIAEREKENLIGK